MQCAPATSRQSSISFRANRTDIHVRPRLVALYLVLLRRKEPMEVAAKLKRLARGARYGAEETLLSSPFRMAGMDLMDPMGLMAHMDLMGLTAPLMFG
jgi:hypothetical protein